MSDGVYENRILSCVQDEDEGTRLDVFAASEADISRARAQALIGSGDIKLNGAASVKRAVLKAGDRVEIFLPPESSIVPEPQNIPIDIVYEDDDLLVVNKKQGMVVHPAPGNPDGTLVNALLYRYGDGLSDVNGSLRPGIVHRIDKDTAGLLLVAKNNAAHTALASQIEKHSFSRCYEAVVRGHLKSETGTVDAPIARHPVDRKRMAVVADGKRAVTHYEVKAVYPGFSHIRLRLETGRTHQIRVHMAYIGHPVAGDPVYGGGTLPGLKGQCLFAKQIGFVHPASGRYMEFEAPLPDYFLNTLRYIDR